MENSIGTVKTCLLCALMAILVSGCVWRFGVNGRHFTHQGGRVTIDTTALRLDGYYWSYLEGDSIHSGVLKPLLLWEDGTAAISQWVYGDFASPDSTQPVTAAFKAAHEQFVGNLKDKTGERESPILLRWGGFRIDGDSISIQVIRTKDVLNIWDPLQYNGYIKNDTTLVLTEYVEPNYLLGYWGSPTPIRPAAVYHFHPLDEKPSSENWTQKHPKLQRN